MILLIPVVRAPISLIGLLFYNKMSHVRKVKQQPSADGWICSCGTTNQGKFCANCGKPKPSGAPLYACDKCGWKPAAPTHPPKFCPQCGDIFDENDKQ